MNLISKLRQLQFPKEFRIDTDEIKLNHNNEFMQLITSLNDLLKTNTTSSNDDNRETNKLIAEISTGLWRLKNKMIDPKSKKPLEEMSRAYRHLDSVWTAIENSGVEIINHDGDIFDSGKSLKALAFEPAAGVERETVIETVKPSIYKNKLCIQMGEVIVGTPAK
jgi:hypothetical protein